MVFLKRMLAAIVTALLLFSHASAGEARFNVLLIGVDAARAGQRGRSDTMMLVSVGMNQGDIRIASFLRDLYVSIPGVGKTRLNAAYHYGGAELLKQTLEKHFGVTVDRTVAVDFQALSDVVDAVGGVEIEVDEKERIHLNQLLDDYPASAKLEAPGLQRLTGPQALCFSRIRKIDSDFQRTSRQQTVIAAMLHELPKLGKWELFKLAVRTLGKVETDLTLGDLSKLLPLVGKLDAANMRTAHVPFDGMYTDETVNGMMVLTPDLKRNRTALDRFFTE